MIIYNRFLIALAVTFGIVNTLLAFFGQTNLAVYFNANAIVYTIIALLYINLMNPKAQASVYRLGAFIFFGFFMTLVFRMVEILK